MLYPLAAQSGIKKKKTVQILTTCPLLSISCPLVIHAESPSVSPMRV